MRSSIKCKDLPHSSSKAGPPPGPVFRGSGVNLRVSVTDSFLNLRFRRSQTLKRQIRGTSKQTAPPRRRDEGARSVGKRVICNHPLGDGGGQAPNELAQFICKCCSPCFKATPHVLPSPVTTHTHINTQRVFILDPNDGNTTTGAPGEG